MKVGDRVRYNNITKKELYGEEGTIVQLSASRQGYIMVRWDYSGNIGAPYVANLELCDPLSTINLTEPEKQILKDLNK